MIKLNKRFLVGRRRIAVKEMNIITLNERRIGEFAAIVSKKNGEDRRE